MSSLSIGNFLPRFPTSYQQQEPRVETGDRLVCTDKGSLRSQMPHVLWQIRSDGITLRAISPVIVRFRSEGQYIFAENEALRVYAYGNTPNEALEQFREHVIHFFESYSKLKDNEVVGEGVRLRAVYIKSFERVRHAP